MELFYEESATHNKASREIRRSKIMGVLSVICFAVAIFGVMISITYVSASTLLAWYILCGWFFLSGIIFRFFKSRFNASYDYVFVSGELRISKVFNTNKRKLRAIIDCSEIVQIGDADNKEIERFASMPDVRNIVCTPNGCPSEGKFFMYIYTNDKSLYLLECRETLLLNILRFTRRGVLEDGYVMQEKKEKQV